MQYMWLSDAKNVRSFIYNIVQLYQIKISGVENPKVTIFDFGTVTKLTVSNNAFLSTFMLKCKSLSQRVKDLVFMPRKTISNTVRMARS